MAVRFAARHEMDHHLGSLAASGAVVLDDRVVVAPSGIWVIDAKALLGQVQKRDVGSLFSVDWRLYVGRRDCTSLLGAVSRRARVVRAALEDETCCVPVLPVLCLCDAEWSWFVKPFQMNGVVVSSPKATAKLVGQPGPWTSDDIHRIADALTG